MNEEFGPNKSGIKRCLYYPDGRSTKGILPIAFLHTSELLMVPMWEQISLVALGKQLAPGNHHLFHPNQIHS